MNPLELTAAGLGLINVALVVRRSLWNYPFGLAMVALYCFIFFEAKLYSDSLLQIFFFVIQLYGWWNWHRSVADSDDVVVEKLDARQRIFWIIGTAIAAAIWGTGMARWTDAIAPYLDATIAGMSIAAQILQSQRRIESWVLWIAVDVIAVGLFWVRGLAPTSILYAIFLAMSVAGLLSWWRQLDPARVQAA